MIKKITSVLLCALMLVSASTINAYAAPTQSNISGIGVTNDAQMEVIKTYSEYITIKARNSYAPEDMAIIDKFFNEQMPKISDTTSDKAQIARAEVAGNILRAIIAYPDEADNTIALFESLLGSKTDNPSPAVQGAIAKSYGKVIELYARYPEQKDLILETINKLSPQITDFSCEEVQMGRASALKDLYSNIARMTDLKDDMINLFISLLGEKQPNPSVKVQASAVESYSTLIQSIARQPEMKSDLLLSMYRLSPVVTDFSHEYIQCARALVLSSAYESATRQPELKNDFIEITTDLTGSKPTITTPMVEGAYAYSYNKVIEGSARQPELVNELIAMKDMLSPAITDLNSQQVQYARTLVLGKLYEAVSRQPEMKDTLCTEFETLLGKDATPNPTPLVEQGVAQSMASYLMAVNRTPEVKTALEDIKNTYSPKISGFNSEEVQIGRAKAINELFDKVVPYMNSNPNFINELEEVLGKVIPIHSFVVSFDTDGGNEVADIVVFNNGFIDEPTGVTKEAYNFVNWTLNGQEFDFASPITQSITLKANWEPVPVDVKSPETGNANFMIILSLSAGIAITLITLRKKQYS